MPPRSPDVTPMDFSVRRFVKDAIYKTKVNNSAELGRKITAAFQIIGAYQLWITWRETEYLLETLNANILRCFYHEISAIKLGRFNKKISIIFMTVINP